MFGGDVFVFELLGGVPRFVEYFFQVFGHVLVGALDFRQFLHRLVEVVGDNLGIDSDLLDGRVHDIFFVLDDALRQMQRVDLLVSVSRRQAHALFYGFVRF